MNIHIVEIRSRILIETTQCGRSVTQHLKGYNTRLFKSAKAPVYDFEYAGTRGKTKRAPEVQTARRRRRATDLRSIIVVVAASVARREDSGLGSPAPRI